METDRFYFGERWDSPQFDEPGWVRVDTPIGKPCALCGEPIECGDRGMFMGGVAVLDGQPTAMVHGHHMECLMLTTIGHTYGVCGCSGFGMDGPSREELVRRLDAQRAERGMGPWREYRRAVPQRRWWRLLARARR